MDKPKWAGSSTSHVCSFVNFVLAAMVLDGEYEDFNSIPGNKIAMSFSNYCASDQLTAEDLRRFLNEQSDIWDFGSDDDDEYTEDESDFF